MRESNEGFDKRIRRNFLSANSEYLDTILGVFDIRTLTLLRFASEVKGGLLFLLKEVYLRWLETHDFIP